MPVRAPSHPTAGHGSEIGTRPRTRLARMALAPALATSVVLILAALAGAPAAVAVAPSAYAPAATSSAVSVETPARAGVPAGKKVRTRAAQRADNLLARVNEARSQGRRCGGTYYPPAPPLRLNHRLTRAANQHAGDMARRNYFSHNGKNDSSPSSRARAAGYPGMAGENIAAGYPSPGPVMAGWLSSPGHCANIMSRQYRDLGVGYARADGSRYRTYWVQDFGVRR